MKQYRMNQFKGLILILIIIWFLAGCGSGATTYNHGTRTNLPPSSNANNSSDVTSNKANDAQQADHEKTNGEGSGDVSKTEGLYTLKEAMRTIDNSDLAEEERQHALAIFTKTLTQFLATTQSLDYFKGDAETLSEALDTTFDVQTILRPNGFVRVVTYYANPSLTGQFNAYTYIQWKDQGQLHAQLVDEESPAAPRYILYSPTPTGDVLTIIGYTKVNGLLPFIEQYQLKKDEAWDVKTLPDLQAPEHWVLEMHGDDAHKNLVMTISSSIDTSQNFTGDQYTIDVNTYDQTIRITYDDDHNTINFQIKDGNLTLVSQ